MDVSATVVSESVLQRAEWRWGRLEAMDPRVLKQLEKQGSLFSQMSTHMEKHTGIRAVAEFDDGTFPWHLLVQDRTCTLMT